jgi:hypothetical protein
VHSPPAPVAVAKPDDIGGALCAKALDYMTRQATDGLADLSQSRCGRAVTADS